MRINNSVFKYIEHELYNYNQTKKDMKLYREQILESTSKPEAGSKSNISDTTASKAVRLVSSTYLMQAERVVDAIEQSLDLLGDRHKELFKLRYERNISWPRITIEMGISDRTYYRMRREIVLTVGQKLGLIKFE